jgi:hypothetical protein
MNVLPVNSVSFKTKSNGTSQGLAGSPTFKSKIPDNWSGMCSLAKKYGIKIESFDDYTSLKGKLSKAIEESKNSSSSSSSSSCEDGKHSLTDMDVFMLTNLNF